MTKYRTEKVNSVAPDFTGRSAKECLPGRMKPILEHVVGIRAVVTAWTPLILPAELVSDW